MEKIIDRINDNIKFKLDKKYHFLAGMLIFLWFTILGLNDSIGLMYNFISCLVLGIGKEIYDYFIYKKKSINFDIIHSIFDFLYTIAGWFISFSLTIIFYLIFYCWK